MKKILILIWSLLAIALLSACVGSTVTDKICPINKSIYVSEETGKTFTIEKFARRERYVCTEKGSIYDYKHDSKNAFRFSTDFAYPKYERVLANDNLECEFLWRVNAYKGLLEKETVYLIESLSGQHVSCCQTVSHSADGIDDSSVFAVKNPSERPGTDNTVPYWAEGDDIASVPVPDKFSLVGPKDNWDLGPMGKGPYNFVGCKPF